MKQISVLGQRYLWWALALAAAVLLLSACAPTNTEGAAQVVTEATGRTITVVGNGEAFGKPDQAQLQIGVETFAPSILDATSNNEKTLAAVRETIKELGVADGDIQTSNFNLWTEQRYGENGPEGIAGYRISNMLNVTIRDIELVDQIIGAATEAGANSIYGVSFNVADLTALETEARQNAIADAEARAQALAALTGITLGEVQVVSEVVGMPNFHPRGLGGGGGEAAYDPTISPGQIAYTIQVQVTYAAD